MLLVDKSAVITGAGSGVGRASALRFASEGAKLICADIREDWAAETVGLVMAAGGSAVAQRCDVTSENDVAATVEAAAIHFGRLDVMFNNAGVSGMPVGMAFDDVSASDFERLVDINFRGVFHGCKHAVKRFKAQGDGGVIINTGSIAGMVAFGNVIYGATKGAVNQITKGVALEGAPLGIRCNAICPGAMPLTNFTLSSPDEEFGERSPEYLEYVATLHPNGRIVTAEDCAAAALFLASDQSENINGVLLPIDGGYIAR